MAPRPTSRAGIEEQNRLLLDRYRQFRIAADALAAALRSHSHVLAVSLIGSVARDPWKEVPRFTPYRRARIELWHECKDLDLALWLSDLSDLNGLRRKSTAVLRELMDRRRIGVAAHQVDVFILEPGTDRYLGRLCSFNTCPKGKRECLVPGCGKTPFLRQHEEFEWWTDTLAPAKAVRLFDRASGTVAEAGGLPLPETAESG